jgi:hypothetical protein
MKKKYVGIIFTLLLVVSFIVASTFPAIATDPKNRPERVAYATIGTVNLELPSNATYPAKAGGTTSHPIVLRISVIDNNRRTTDGASDQMVVNMWDPEKQSFTPVLIITDNPSWAEYLKTLYNNSYTWFPTPVALQPIYGPNLFPNVVLVEPDELEVWTESANPYDHSNGWDNQDSQVLMVNLTRAVKSTLDVFVINSSVPAGPNSPRFANATFILPPLTMVFHEFNDYYADEKVDVLQWAGSSNYTVKQSSVEVSA